MDNFHAVQKLVKLMNRLREKCKIITISFWKSKLQQDQGNILTIIQIKPKQNNPKLNAKKTVKTIK